MDKENNKVKSVVNSSNITAPKILMGMIPSVFVLIFLMLSISWYIIDYQVEDLLAKRTSEYAHSIVKIAADSSAEALLSEDNLQLELLAQNIAKDRYIRVATIYSADGIVVTQYPQEENSSNQSAADQSNKQTLNEISDTNNKKDTSKLTISESSLGDKKKDERKGIKEGADSKLVFDYLAAKKNIPFIEKIVFKGITAGWFKIEIDGYQLESDFRENFHQIRLKVFALVAFLMLIIIYILFRYRRKVDALVSSVNLLVWRKALESDTDVSDTQNQWFEQVDSLAESSFSKPIRLRELRQQVRWKDEETLESIPLVWFVIDLPKNDNHDLAEQVVKIEKYVKAATNAYFTYFQGEIFTGGLVPFLQHSPSEKSTTQIAYTELISFTYLMKELMNTLDKNIEFRAILFSSNLYKLSSDDSVQNRVILPQRKKLQINKLANLIGESNICCLIDDSSLLDGIAEHEVFLHKQKKIINTYLLNEANRDIVNHAARISKTIIESDIRN